MVYIIYHSPRAALPFCGLGAHRAPLIIFTSPFPSATTRRLFSPQSWVGSRFFSLLVRGTAVFWSDRRAQCDIGFSRSCIRKLSGKE